MKTLNRFAVIAALFALASTIGATHAFAANSAEKAGLRAAKSAEIQPVELAQEPADPSRFEASAPAPKVAPIAAAAVPVAINTISGVKNIPGDYATLALAIADLNLQGVGVGGVTLNLIAGNPQTAPAGGYVIGGAGSLVLTTASASNPITIQGNGNTITAFTPQTVSNINDAIFKLIGADFVTLTGFTMQENAANTINTTGALNNMTEFGVAMFYVTATDGCQNNTISNNTISLNRSYRNTLAIYSNTRTTAAAVATLAEATAASGSNSFNRVYGNAISNTNYGIVFIGASTAAVIDNGNDIGGSSPATGNVITNFGSNTTALPAAVSGYISLTGNNYAIFDNQQINDNVSFNTITSAATLASGITEGGILKNYSAGQPTGTIATLITNNTVTVTNATTGTTVGGVIGINNQGLTPLLATATMSITNNTVTVSQGGTTATTAGVTSITNLSLPGTIIMSGNTILNPAVTAPSATTAVVAGITNSGAAGTLNISSNILRGFSSTAASGQCQGIVNSGAVTTAIGITNNQIGTAASGYFTSNVASSGAIFGLTTQGGAATCVVTIQNNDVRGITYNVLASSSPNLMTSTANTKSQNFSGNTFTNLNINTTGTILCISNGVSLTATGSKVYNNNSIVGSLNKGGAGNSIIFINDLGLTSPNGSTSATTNNTFSNVTATGATAVFGINNQDGNSGTDGPTKTCTGNTISNITVNGTGAITGMFFDYGGTTGSVISGNTISNVTGQGAIAALNVGSTVAGAGILASTTGNVISNISSTGAGGAVSGIAFASPGGHNGGIVQNSISGLSSTSPTAVVTGISVGSGSTLTVSKNKICDLSESANTATTPMVNGILLSGATTVTASNNLIGGLTAPASTSTDAIRGISVTSTTAPSTYNLYFNTVHFSASSSGANFGTSGVFHAASATPTTASIDLRNNIVSNQSVPAGTGLTVAYRRSGTALNNFAATSDRNLWYAGSPGASNLIFNDGVNSDQTLAAYKTRVTPVDANAVTENPPFLSTSCGSGSFLHIDPLAATQIESGASPVAGVADDYDGDLRNGSTPDIGADEFTSLVTLAASAGANGSISPSGTFNVPRGSNQTFTITPATCYSIADVLVDGVSVGAVASYTFTNLQANHTIAASFAITLYTITSSAGAGGSIAPNGATSVACGANQPFTITASGGYNIQDVLVDGSSVGAVGAYTFLNVTANHTIDASFVAVSFPVVDVETSNGYTTIQAAIDDAATLNGHHITVAAGTYNERVTLSKSLSILGAGEALTVLDGTGLSGPGSGITINTGITNVELRDLTVKNYAGAGPNSYAGIYAIGGNNALSVHNVTLKDNVGGCGFYANGPVNGITLDNLDVSGHNNSFGAARGIVVWNGLKENITITNCDVYNNNCCGIELQDGTASGVTLENNNIHDNGDNGIGVVGLQGPGENLIKLNTLTDNGRFGIEVKNPDGSGAASGPGRVVVENNTVSRTVAIGAEARDIGGIVTIRRGVLAGNVDVPNGAVIQNNVVSGYTQPSVSEGFGIVMEGTNHTVTGNTVSGCDVGIQRQSGHLPYPGDGDQSNVADTYFGRGNSPVACGITVSGNILSNTVDTRDVPLSAGATATAILSITTIGNGSVTKSPDLPVYGCATSATVTLTATADPGWYFAGWSGDASGSTNPLTVLMDANKSITATFALAPVTDITSGFSFTTIQAAISDLTTANGDIIVALAGTFTENVVLNKRLTLRGAQSGVAGCGRVTGAPNPATETIITAAPGTRLLQLVAGSAGSVIDGFTFLGGGRQIESSSGPLDNLSIRNNHFTGFTSNAIFLNDPGVDVTVDRNNVDAGSQTSSDGSIHLDTDSFRGFYLTNNCIGGVPNAPNGSGFFVDGANNVSPSPGRTPLIDGNILERHATNVGANLGSRSFTGGTISNNEIRDNKFDGIQGGIQNTTIRANKFLRNNRWGLALTSFGSLSAGRGAVNVTVTLNTFANNDSAGYFISATQPAGNAASCHANENDIVNNGSGAGGLRYGAIYRGTETFDVGCNWWGDIGGPNYPPTNPNPLGDKLFATTATFSPWLNASITGPHACDQTIKHTIVASAGPGGSITPSGNVLVDDGANQSFTIADDGCHTIADVLVDGVSVGAVSSYTFLAVVTNHTIAASFSLIPPTITAVTGLSSSQQKTGNDADGTTKIKLTFTAPGGAATLEVWRKGYGSYPTYDNGGGSVPTLPGSYPPAGWAPTLVTASGQSDEPPTRDFWYYVAYAKDACGNVGPVSNLSAGTLDYHLGDVSDGITAGQGDNTVGTPDVSLLGAHYGLSGGALAGFEYLDVGPTTDFSTNARPTTDSKTNFEDLVMFAINHAPAVSLVKKGGTSTQSVNSLALEAPAEVAVGDVFEVPVQLTGAGDLQALSLTLGWNAAVVEPIDMTPGELVTSQGGVVFSPGPGRADAAMLGAGHTMSGQGTVATVRFRALAAGEPRVSIAVADGRSSSNQAVKVTVQNPLAVEARVTATDLQPVIPNPSPGRASLHYSLATRGAVDLSIYSVDGRRVKTLAHGVQEVGRYHVTWDGSDERGSVAKAGVYFVRLEAPALHRTRIITLLK